MGVLFLDELPEFKKNTLEVLRGPLESRKVTISRVNSVVTYPSNFMLIASMNPCRCGYYGSDDNRCRCSESSINSNLAQIARTYSCNFDDEKEGDKYEIGNLNEYLEIYSNSELTPKLIEKYCKIDNESKELLQKVFEKFGLSGRAYSRILKLARTIADLDEEENIMKKHIAEAIQYRVLDRKYWRSKY